MSVIDNMRTPCGGGNALYLDYIDVSGIVLWVLQDVTIRKTWINLAPPS